MIGIVVPTLGTRVAALTKCIQSLQSNNLSRVCIVAPAHVSDEIAIRYPGVQIVADPRRGLAAAINEGIQTFPREVRYVNWLGDDDQLVDGGLAQLYQALENDPSRVLAYGMCEYVNSKGTRLFLNRSAKWSEVLMRFGPQLVSQPAMLFRRENFDAVGGLDESLSYAFDLDLLLKLHQIGNFVRVPTIAARYSWHEEALTVASRRNSVIEASKVRTGYVPQKLKFPARIWEFVMRRMIFSAGRMLSAFAERKSQS